MTIPSLNATYLDQFPRRVDLDHTEFRVLTLQLPHSEQMHPDGVH